ncbi:MAG TPA: polysaccharide deacetylase family protein [Bryobacteraceae bacterium]|nr:polysaccharide deacetylase family protein [Bryobacteraceae bacterium]
MRSEQKRRLGMAAAAGAGAASAWMAWAVRGRSSAVFGSSVWRGDSRRRALALTFDDGPSEATPEILDLLGRFQVRATFFQCGHNVDRLPAIARAVRDAGHLIGNHTYSHPMFAFQRARFIEEELRLAQEAIERHTGVRPAWFRAPYGVRWFGLDRAQRLLGLTGVMWTIIGYDWKLKAGAVVKRVAAGASNGAIVCLHDGRELRARPDAAETVKAVRRLVPMLLDQGYTFETVDRLLCPTN